MCFENDNFFSLRTLAFELELKMGSVDVTSYQIALSRYNI